MCGINVIISSNTKPLTEAIAAMQQVSKFRGPDASATIERRFGKYNLAIGVNRLHVIDNLAVSNQPMVSSDEKYLLAFNGEVYNYQDLKNQLIIKGYQFNSNSDSEVVLYWLQEFGSSGIADFKGMFALVFIDFNKNEIIVARDKHGIKPLFYHYSSGLLIISSSILAIDSSGMVKLSINKAAINDYLAFRHVKRGQSFYQEVLPINPGSLNLFDQSLNLDQAVVKSKPLEHDANLKSTLIDTISLLSQAQSAPGLLLSGGVDSTLLLAMTRHELGTTGLETYTMNCGEDAVWAKKAAVQFNSQHHEINVNLESLQQLDDFLSQTDQPIADSGAFATFLVAQEAGKNSNVLFSGAGADELFGGYNRHRAYYYYLTNKKKVLLAKRLGKLLGTRKLVPDSVGQLLAGAHSDPQQTYRNFLENYAVCKNDNDIERLWQKQESLINNMEQALVYDSRNYLVDDVLAITDNATMQQGIEARVPYLYDDVVGCADSISVEEKMKNRGKGPLKQLLIEYGGTMYTKRPKLGFGLPLANWFRDKKTYQLWDFLREDAPIFQYLPKQDISSLVDQHQRHKANNGMQLWSILVLENWLGKFYK